ncbi:MAG: HAMP domain-containing protein [Acidobacteriia bacterium]|nr:HAMP domain-containing protein [Terriglobia bacterium]
MFKFRIWHKLSLIAFLMGVPVVALVFLFVQSQNRQINATKNELAGLEYLTQVRSLLENVPHHRAAAAAVLGGDTQSREELLAMQDQIELNIKSVGAVEGKYGAAWRTAESWAHIKNGWPAIRDGALAQGPKNSMDQHNKMMADLLAHVQLVGERSQLRTDFELSTFYLADSLINTLGWSSEYVGQLLALGNGVSTKQKATPEESAQLTYLTRQIQQAGEQTRRNLLTAIKYNPRVASEISAVMNTTVDAANVFSNYANEQFLKGSAGLTDVRAYSDRGKEALHQYFRLYDLTATTLSDQLAKRAKTLQTDTYKQLLLAGVVLLLAAIAVYLVSSGIAGQVTAINNTFTEVRSGNYGARVEISSNDELGEMSRSVNNTFDNTLALIQSKDERDQIQRSIQKLLEEVSGVAEGDLSKEAEVTADVTGAIADSFNYMLTELRQIISSVQETTREVTKSAQEVQATAESLAQGSQSQSVQIVEASEAIGEMATSIQHVASTANSAAVVAEQALFSAQQGSLSVHKTIEGMNSIRGQVQETSKRIKRLGESSQEIGEISQLISDIADRTSILALNASIQAAMAGEAGRGFAVVAEEVERLAEQAAQSTQRITSIIQSVQGDTKEAISAMEDTTREVVAGSQLANEAGLRLGQIMEVSKRISELVRSISDVSKQQAEGSEFVSRNVTGISSVTQLTAEGAKQAADKIRSLTHLAAELNQSVSRFKLPAVETNAV